MRGERSGRQYRLVQADVRCLPFDDAAFDVVCAMDIIEHVDKDKMALAEICRVLKPGGRLLATVPAYMSLWGEHDVALHHHRRYTAHGFRDVVRRAGLHVERTSYTVTSLLPPIAIIRSIKRLLSGQGRPPKTDVLPVPAVVNRMLLALMDAETQIVRRLSLPFGVTVIAVARKES
jgi:SAM-dependent methyltransferase